MNRNLFVMFLLTTSLIAASCGSKKSSSAHSSTSSQVLSEKEMQDYKSLLTEVFKNKVTTITVTQKNGCIMSTTELEITLGEQDNGHISYIKTLSGEASLECKGSKLGSKNQVEVRPDEVIKECTPTGTKTGSIINITYTCQNGVVTTIDLDAKTLKYSYTGENETIKIFSKSTSVERDQLIKNLSNVLIVYYKKGEDNDSVVDRKVTGNANKILNLVL